MMTFLGSFHTLVLCLPAGDEGWVEELAVWSGSGLVGCSAVAEAEVVSLFPPQSEGDHLLGLGADCVYGEYKCVHGVHFCVSMLGVCA